MAMNELVKRVARIQEELSDGQPQEKKGKKGKKEKVDEFMELKGGLSAQLREVRKTIKERDELAEKAPGTKATVEASARIREQIKKAREDAKKMSQVQRQQARKKKKDPEYQEVVSHRGEVVDLVFKHIEECENLEKRRITEKTASQRGDLFKGVTVRPAAGGLVQPDPTESELPDIDVEEGLALIQKQDDQMDEALDEISAGVGNLKQVALVMHDEIELQNVMVDEIQGKVDKSSAHLKNINKKMKKTLQKVRKGDRFILDFIVLCVLLGIAGFVYKIVVANTGDDAPK